MIPKEVMGMVDQIVIAANNLKIGKDGYHEKEQLLYSLGFIEGLTKATSLIAQTQEPMVSTKDFEKLKKKYDDVFGYLIDVENSYTYLYNESLNDLIKQSKINKSVNDAKTKE